MFPGKYQLFLPRDYGSRTERWPLILFLLKPDRSEELVDRLKRCNANVKLTLYPDAGHDAWTRTYENPELYDWFLQHRRHAAP